MPFLNEIDEKSEARWRALTALKTQILWTMDPSGEVIDVQSTWMAFTGQSQSQSTGWGWLEAIYPEDRARTEHMVRNSTPRACSFEIEHRLCRRDGTHCEMLFQAAPVFDWRGNLIEWIIIHTDLSRYRSSAGTPASRIVSKDSVDLEVQHLRLALESSDVGTWEWEVETGAMKWDVRCRRLHGVSADAPVSHDTTFMAALHPDDSVRREATLSLALDPSIRALYDIEHRIIGIEDGVTRWCHVTGRTIFEQGQPTRMVGTIQEVTARKQSEAERDAALSRLRAHVDNTPLAVIEWNRDFRVIAWSRGAETTFGWLQQQVVGEHPYEWGFIDERDIPLVSSEMERIVESDSVRSILHSRNITQDGSRIECEWYNSAVYDDEGQVVSVLSMILDVSKRVRAEAERESALARAEAERQRFQRLLVSAPLIVQFLRGPDHIVDFVNEALVSIIPQARDFVGQSLRTITTPSHVPHEFLVTLDRVYVEGQSYFDKEVAVLPPHADDSERRFFNVTYQPIRRSDGTVEGVAGFAFDVTDPVRARQALELLAQREEAARRKAEEASRIKEDFLSTLSHELRTPLNAIIGWADILRTRNLSEEQRDRAIETVGRNARVQARLIEDLLDLSRIMQGKFVFSPTQVDLHKIVEVAFDAVRPAVEAKNIDLQSRLEKTATVFGDVDRLQQIILNLLSNAVKFTPNEGTIQVQLRRTTNFVEVSVADNGQGIHSSFLPHVFDRFRQANSTITREFGGLGLGLSIVRSLVELHGGTATAASDGPGMGSTFVVRFPTDQSSIERKLPLSKSTQRLAARDHSMALPSLAGVRVLVVDDEADARDLIEFVLRERGMYVTTAGGPGEGLAAFGSYRFDVLLSDVGMPGEDGLSFIRKIRKFAPEMGGQIPALALTAYARSEDRIAVFEAGFNMHLAKPIEPSELLSVVVKLVGLAPSASPDR